VETSSSRLLTTSLHRRKLITAASGALVASQSVSRSARAQGSPVTVVWFGGRDTSGVTTTQVAAFNESHPDIQIDYQEQGATSDDLRAKIIAVGSSQDPAADIYSVNVPNVTEYAAAGWTIPVDDIIPEAERADFYPGSIAGALYDGHLYAVPHYNNGPGLWYRKDLLDDAGLEVPKTYDELVAVCQELQTPEIAGYVLPLPQIEQGNINWLEHVWGYGGDLVDDQLNVVVDQGTAAVDAYHRLLRYVYEDKVVPEYCLTLAQTSDAMNIFRNGEAVFLRMWMSSGGQLAEPDTVIKGLWDVTTLPSQNGEAPGPGCLGTWNLGISAYSQKQEAAAEVIKWLIAAEQQTERALVSGQLPSRIAVVDDPAILEKFPYAARIQEALQSLRPRPVTPYYGQWTSDVLQPTLGAVMTRQKTPEDAVVEMAAQMRQIAGQ
jgi:multiple sugar transport system substrate-binding protein